MDFVSKLELQDLDEEQRRIAEVIGIESYRQLVKNYGGISIYVPKSEMLTIRVRNDVIKAEFDGTNITQLARKYNITETWARYIVSEQAKEMKRRPMEGQIGLFI